MASVSFDPQNLIVKLQTVEANVPNALRAAGVSLLNAAAREITSGDGSFAPWSRNYARFIRAHQQLWLTGTLLRSLTVGGASNEFDLQGDVLKIGSNVRYAAAQNFGYPARNLPARPFLFINQKRADDAKAAFAAQLFRDIK